MEKSNEQDPLVYSILQCDGELSQLESLIARLEDQLRESPETTLIGLRKALAEARILANRIRGKRDRLIRWYEYLTATRTNN